MRNFRMRLLSVDGLCAIGLLALFSATPGAGSDDGGGDWSDWVDEQERLRQRIADVNEGELSFLTEGPESLVHHHVNHILITPQSLVDGWVVLDQCHRNLDRVSEAQIVFDPERSRALEVMSVRNVDAAYVERHAVQLRGVGEGSEVCLRLETRALHPLGGGLFELRNGPFMRRFLDGFYPLRLSLRVDYPTSMTLVDFVPEAQPGFVVSRNAGRIGVEATFEGRLYTAFRFVVE